MFCYEVSMLLWYISMSTDTSILKSSTLALIFQISSLHVGKSLFLVNVLRISVYIIFLVPNYLFLEGGTLGHIIIIINLGATSANPTLFKKRWRERSGGWREVGLWQHSPSRVLKPWSRTNVKLKSSQHPGFVHKLSPLVVRDGCATLSDRYWCHAAPPDH